MSEVQNSQQLSGSPYQRPFVQVVDEDDEDEIDISEIFRVLVQHIGQMIAVALLGAVVTLAGTIFLIKPTYRSGFTAFVNNRNGQEQTQSVQSGDVAASQSLTKTYAAIMESRPVIEDALKESGLADNEDYEYGNIKEAITTDVESDAQLVSLYVTLRDPEAAYKLADAISNVAPSYISDIVEGTSMKIVSDAILPTGQYSPHPMKNAAIGAVIGALLVIILVIVRSLTDTRIKNEQDLQERFGIPVIGTIPNYEDATNGKKKYGKYGNYGYYEAASKARKKSDSARARRRSDKEGK